MKVLVYELAVLAFKRHFKRLYGVISRLTEIKIECALSLQYKSIRSFHSPVINNCDVKNFVIIYTSPYNPNLLLR